MSNPYVVRQPYRKIFYKLLLNGEFTDPRFIQYSQGIQTHLVIVKSYTSGGETPDVLTDIL